MSWAVAHDEEDDEDEEDEDEEEDEEDVDEEGEEDEEDDAIVSGGLTQPWRREASSSSVNCSVGHDDGEGVDMCRNADADRESERERERK
eukprot:3810811-Pyramimonas_sp.AAC.1